MSCRDWLRYIAIGGSLIAGALLLSSALYAQKNNQQQQPTTAPANQTQPETDQPFPKAVVGPFSLEREKPIEPNWAEPNCQKPGNHDEADLCQQRSMAEATQKAITLNYVQIGIGFVTLIGLALTVYFTRKTADAAVDAVDLSRKAYVAEHRAWMKVQISSVGPIRFSKDKISVRISLEGENIGEPAAVNVHVAAAPFVSHGVIPTRSAVDDFIQKELARISHPMIRGMVLMRGEKTGIWAITNDAETDAETEKRSAEIANSGLPQKTAISIAFGVFYKSLISDEWRYSVHLVYVHKIDQTDFDPSLGEVAPDNIMTTVLPQESQMT